MIPLYQVGGFCRNKYFKIWLPAAVLAVYTNNIVMLRLSSFRRVRWSLACARALGWYKYIKNIMIIVAVLRRPAIDSKRTKNLEILCKPTRSGRAYDVKMWTRTCGGWKQYYNVDVKLYFDEIAEIQHSLWTRLHKIYYLRSETIEWFEKGSDIVRNYFKVQKYNRAVYRTSFQQVVSVYWSVVLTICRTVHKHF